MSASLVQALGKRGSATRQWADGYLRKQGLSASQANRAIDEAIASGAVVQHQGVLATVKANPAKGRSMAASRPTRSRTPRANHTALAQARAELAQKRFEQGRRLAAPRKAAAASSKPPRPVKAPRPLTKTQMFEHNRRVAPSALPSSSVRVRSAMLGAPISPFEENPVMSKPPLTAAQKKALAQGRAKLAAERSASGKKPSGKKPSKTKKPSGKKPSKPKAAKKPARARKTVSGKRKPSPKQLAALARGRAKAAANRRKEAAAAKPAPKRKAPKRAPKKAAKPAATKHQKSRVTVAREHISRAGRALAAPRKKGAKPSKTIHSGTYTDKSGQSIILRRSYPKSNPVVEFKQIAIAGGGLAFGWVAAELIDRYVATRAPENSETALSGPNAAAAITGKPDGVRLAVSGGGTLAFGIGAYLLRDRMPDVAYGLGGIGAGFGIKFFSQLVGDMLLPWIFKVDKSKDKWEESYAYRLFPDKPYYEKTPEAPPGQTPASFRGYVRGPYGQMGAPRPWAGAQQGQQVPYPFAVAPAPRADAGPVATGAVGCGCGRSAMRAIYGNGGSVQDVFCPTCKGCKGCGTCKCGGKRPPMRPCPSCATPPEPVEPPPEVVPTMPEDSDGTPARPDFMQPLPNLSEQQQPALSINMRGAEQAAVRMMAGQVTGPEPEGESAPEPPPEQPSGLSAAFTGAAAVMELRRQAPARRR